MAFCYDCGLEYGSDEWIEAIVPDRIWHKISPHGCVRDGGILCISCIVRRLRKLGYEQGSIPIWLCGTEPVYAVEGDPSENLEVLRTFDLEGEVT